MLSEAAVLRRASPWEQIPALHRMFLKYSSWRAPWHVTLVAWKLVNTAINSKVVPFLSVRCCCPHYSAWLAGGLQGSSFPFTPAERAPLPYIWLVQVRQDQCWPTQAQGIFSML